MSQQKRHSITLETKYKIMKFVEEKKSYECVYRLFPDIKCHKWGGGGGGGGVAKLKLYTTFVNEVKNIDCIVF